MDTVLKVRDAWLHLQNHTDQQPCPGPDQLAASAATAKALPTTLLVCTEAERGRKVARKGACDLSEVSCILSVDREMHASPAL